MASEKQPLLPTSTPGQRYALVIHGGAGTMSKAGSTPEQRAAYKAGLRAALEAAYRGIKSCAKEARQWMQWSRPSRRWKNELEASLMLSKPPASHPEIPASRRGLGVTLITRAKNPSQLVRALYLAPSAVPHTFISGATAENIGASLGVQLVDPSYFFTENRWREHRRGLGLPEEPLPQQTDAPNSLPPLDQLPTGTVGAVALDVRGCIASLTSTGGRTNKLVGRIGDTPSMGSGFWAEEWNRPEASWVQKVLDKLLNVRQEPTAVGVSGTGDGDYFIRLATASTITRRVQYLHESLETASQAAVEDLLVDGGIGGVIGLDNMGNDTSVDFEPSQVALQLNCPGMYRGVIREDGVPKTAIFADDMLD
ncbi:hypothetical protein H0H92_008523 [Tricholoma furcatifolium]|nr:hypothetical protein H0H92_008523 [Tricholoma furcatifolium]